MIRTYTIVIPVVGASGSATGTASTAAAIMGRIEAVHISYSGQPATCDVTIATVDAPALTLLSVTNNATSGWFHPVHGSHLSTDASAITSYERFVIGDQVVVTVAQGNGGAVSVTLKVDE